MNKLSLLAAASVFSLQQTGHSALTAHWTFDEGTGTLAASSVNSPAQDGTLTNGPTWNTSTNPVGSAGIEFADTDDIVLTNSMGITGTGARTFAMWIRADNQVDAPGMTMLSYGGSNGNGSRYSFRLNNNAANGTLGGVRLEVAGGYIVGTTGLLDGQWHHVAVTNAANSDVNQTLIYVDGLLEASTGAVSRAINSGGTQLLAIGGSTHSAVYNFTGGIDDVRIYDTVLSAAEIRSLATIPEPSGASLLGLSALVLMLRRRRR
jgi:hypothetical protein